jgi:hypothetical protein
VKSAKKRLGIVSTKECRENGFSGWAWSLPGPAARRPAQDTGPLGPLGPLGPVQEVQEDQGVEKDRKELGQASSLSLSTVDEINRQLEEDGYGI